MPFVMMFSAEALANYASSAVFTIINLMVSFFILYRFLFKPCSNYSGTGVSTSHPSLRRQTAS